MSRWRVSHEPRHRFVLGKSAKPSLHLAPPFRFQVDCPCQWYFKTISLLLPLSHTNSNSPPLFCPSCPLLYLSPGGALPPGGHSLASRLPKAMPTPGQGMFPAPKGMSPNLSRSWGKFCICPFFTWTHILSVPHHSLVVFHVTR